LKGGPAQRGRRRTLAARRCGARGGPAAGRLPASGLLGSAPGVPVRETRRSGRSGALRRCGNRHGGATHQRRSRVKFRRGRGSNRGKRARRGAWERGETTTRLWEAWVWRSSEATAAQGRSARRSCASATDLGFGGSGGGGGEVGCRGVAGATYRAAAALACAPGWEGRRIPRRGSRLRLRGGGRRVRQRGPGCQRLASTRGRRRLGPRWQGACAAEASGVSCCCAKQAGVERPGRVRGSEGGKLG